MRDFFTFSITIDNRKKASYSDTVTLVQYVARVRSVRKSKLFVLWKRSLIRTLGVLRHHSHHLMIHNKLCFESRPRDLKDNPSRSKGFLDARAASDWNLS